MTALDRKLLRDLWHIRSQAAAICLVMACGVATMVMSLSTLASLDATQSRYYERYKLADVFARLKRAPESLADRLAQIPGVASIETRVAVDVVLDIPGLTEPAAGRLVSIPDRQAAGLNELHLRRGRFPAASGRGETLVSEAFADAHDFDPGDSLTAVINGRRQSLTIVGVALSPEYVYPIRPGEFLPDDKRFGVLWMGRRELSAAYDMRGAFNDVSIELAPGASEAEVVRRVDSLTSRYGGVGAHGRADQLSYRFVQNEMSQLRGMASLPPTIFLGVSAFLLHVVMSRLIGVEREQIAALRAFGYTRREIGAHYFKLVLLLAGLGAAAGVAAGAWMGSWLTAVYTRFFRFPTFEFQLDFAQTALAVGVGVVAAMLGVASAIMRAARSPPAEAMRPEPPANYRPAIIERLGLGRFVPRQTRMILRNLERQPVRSALSCLGIALATAILVMGNSGKDAIDFVLEFQFERAQRHDVMVTLVEPASDRARFELARLPGVRRVEPFRSVPVRVRFGHRTRRLGLLGLPRERSLFRLLDVEGREANPPTEGLLISEKLAEVLDCRIGDTLTLEVLEGERPVLQAVVAGALKDFADPAAYMDLEALHRMMHEGDCLSGAFLAVDASREAELYQQLKELPKAAGVNIKRAALTSFRDTVAENLLRMRLINVTFASIIAFGVVYNGARIALSERGRELATLRVLGFSRREISIVLLGELAIVTLIAIPVGLVLGFGLATLLMAAIETELQRFPAVIAPSTYAFSAVVTAVAAVLSGLVVRRRLDRLDLVAVLKSRE